MDFSLLKSFIAVADEKSFSTAAKHLFISQQSLSKQIAKLEEELGTPLFIRSRPLELTPDGRLFLRTAKGILLLKQQYEDASSRSFSGGHFIHVGIEHTIARAILPRILPRYIQAHPETYVKVSEGSPDVLQKAVAHDAVDLVIGSLSSTPDSYQSRCLCEKDQLLVVPKAIMEELAGEASGARRAEFAECADLRFFEKAPFIKMSRQSSSGRALSAYLKFYDISPRFVCELTNVENAFRLALSGVGIFVYSKLFWDMMSPEVREDALRSVDVFPLPRLQEVESVCAYYNTENGLHHTTSELLEVFTAFFEDYKNGSLI